MRIPDKIQSREGYVFDKKYFSSGSYKNYEKEISRWVPYVAKKISNIINKKNAKILDVGCAQGYLIAALQNNYNYSVKGVDFSSYAVKKSEMSVRKKISQGDILNLSFRKDSFDAVICLDVINYLEKDEIAKAIKNLTKIAKEYIFFGAIFKHAWTSSQKWNPDKFRKSILAKKEYIDIFRRRGARLIQVFDGENGGSILVFQKFTKRTKH